MVSLEDAKIAKRKLETDIAKYTQEGLQKALADFYNVVGSTYIDISIDVPGQTCVGSLKQDFYVIPRVEMKL